MQVAEVEAMPIGKYKALSVTRFDRMYSTERNIVMRRHMIDACQALGFSVARKYERNLGSSRDVRHIREGVNLGRLFSIADHCTTPWYDLVNVQMYPVFDQELAMTIGDEFEADKVHAYQLAKSILSNLDKAVKQAWELTEAESKYVEAYKKSIQIRCEYYLAQVEEMKQIEL